MNSEGTKEATYRIGHLTFTIIPKWAYAEADSYSFESCSLFPPLEVLSRSTIQRSKLAVLYDFHHTMEIIIQIRNYQSNKTKRDGGN